MNVRIGPLTYHVKEIPNFKVEDTPLYGALDRENGAIFLEKEQPEKLKKVSLMHEILHEIDVQSNLKLSENQVKVLAYALCSVTLNK